MKKSLVLIGTLPLLAACHSGMTQPKPTTITSLSGKIQNWTAGAGTLQLEGITASGTTGVIGTGSVAADGTISGVLPSAGQVNPYLVPISNAYTSSSNCTNSLKIGGSGNIAIVPLYTVVVGEKTVALVLPGGSGSTADHLTSQTLIYADHAVSISGQESCSGEVAGQSYSIAYNLNLNLGVGWNVVNVDGQGKQNNLSFTETSTDKLAATWVINPGNQTMSVQPSKLNLSQNFLR